MRLRPLTEAECYARCYGGQRGERVGVTLLPARRTKRATLQGEHLRELFEQRLDAHGREAEAA